MHRYYLAVLAIFCSLVVNIHHSYAFDHIGPADQRTVLLPGESFFERYQYWSSSVIQIDSEPYFSVSTRATSLLSNIDYDFWMNVFGPQCQRVNVLISINDKASIPDMENQFGKIIFDGSYEHNFRFFVKTFRDTNIIGFYPNDVDSLIKKMMKHNLMVIDLPSIDKKIFYTLIGFSKAINRSSKMCFSTESN